MTGNFTFHNPAKLYFGEEAIENLSKELENYGNKVMHGGGSIKRNGIYEAVKKELEDAVKKFCLLAQNVWDVRTEGKSAKEVALEGLERMEEWMRSLAMNITGCGADESMLEGIADACPINESGYVVLSRADVMDILRKSL